MTIECVRGDITRQPDMLAIVNAANAQLEIGGGVAGAIHRAAGPELTAACRPLAPICPGEAVITPAFRLPNRYVIHCLGPIYGVDEPSAALLASCYRRALDLAEDHDIESVAFPALSTGAFGFPMEPAAEIAFATVVERMRSCRAVKRVRFVLFDAEATRVHRTVLLEEVNRYGQVPARASDKRSTPAR
jgi:O-acetyl-ADP-ribose deacetylase